jgi:hypothetical protein
VADAAASGQRRAGLGSWSLGHRRRGGGTGAATEPGRWTAGLVAVFQDGHVPARAVGGGDGEVRLAVAAAVRGHREVVGEGAGVVALAGVAVQLTSCRLGALARMNSRLWRAAGVVACMREAKSLRL